MDLLKRAHHHYAVKRNESDGCGTTNNVEIKSITSLSIIVTKCCLSSEINNVMSTTNDQTFSDREMIPFGDISVVVVAAAEEVRVRLADVVSISSLSPSNGNAMAADSIDVVGRSRFFVVEGTTDVDGDAAIAEPFVVV
jgi:hypothetical protein